MCSLAAVLNVQAILAVLLEEDLCVAVRVSQSSLEVDGTLAVDAADDMSLRRKVVPVGKVGSTDRLIDRIELLGGVVVDVLGIGEARQLLDRGQSIAALDDEDALGSLALSPADAARLGLGGDVVEDEELLNL